VSELAWVMPKGKGGEKAVPHHREEKGEKKKIPARNFRLMETHGWSYDTRERCKPVYAEWEGR